MITEEEAKLKWCPHARTLAIFRDADGKRETAGCFNRAHTDDMASHSRCVASQCMMWRWSEPTMKAHDSDQRVTYDGRAAAKGYCGLAGTP